MTTFYRQYSILRSRRRTNRFFFFCSVNLNRRVQFPGSEFILGLSNVIHQRIERSLLKTKLSLVLLYIVKFPDGRIGWSCLITTDEENQEDASTFFYNQSFSFFHAQNNCLIRLSMIKILSRFLNVLIDVLK